MGLLTEFLRTFPVVKPIDGEDGSLPDLSILPKNDVIRTRTGKKILRHSISLISPDGRVTCYPEGTEVRSDRGRE